MDRGHVTSGGSSVVRTRRNIGGAGRAQETQDPTERSREPSRVHTDQDTFSIRHLFIYLYIRAEPVLVNRIKAGNQAFREFSIFA